MDDPRLAVEGRPNSMTGELGRDGKTGVPNQVMDRLADVSERSTWATSTDSNFESFVGYFDEFCSRCVLTGGIDYCRQG